MKIEEVSFHSHLFLQYLFKENLIQVNKKYIENLLRRGTLYIHIGADSHFRPFLFPKTVFRLRENGRVMVGYLGECYVNGEINRFWLPVFDWIRTIHPEGLEFYGDHKKNLIWQQLGAPDELFAMAPREKEYDVLFVGRPYGNRAGILNRIVREVPGIKLALFGDKDWKRHRALRPYYKGYLPNEKPRVPGFEIAGWNKPADQTGGDAFDFIPTDDGRLGLLIADATGHGVGPALMVAECRALLRGLASITVDLTQIMAKANEVLFEDLQEGRFVTVCLAFVNPETSTISHLSAGHGPLIHYVAAEDRFVELPAATLPLGISEILPGGPAPDIVLEPGDLFILITDGFFEWIRTDGEQFGMKRLYRIIRDNRQSACSEIIERLHQAVVEYGQGTPQEDDLTAIVVKKL